MATQPNKQFAKISKTAVPLLKRTAVFLSLFILFSGIIGPRIINGGLVGKDGFQVYGGAGKALLFGIIALLLLISRKGLDVRLQPWRHIQSLWLTLAFITASGTWLAVSKLLAGNGKLTLIAATHLSLLATIILIAIGVFGSQNLLALYRIYKKELLLAIGLAIAFYGFLVAVYSLWQVLSAAVLHATRWLLSLTGLRVAIAPPRTLLLDKFGITVAQYCSGIESIALFTGLYTIIGVLDWAKLNHKRFAWIFPVALVILFALNILRVFVLILAGYYINPQIAFSLFHTYAGMLFFIIYSGIFWTISYKWLLHKDTVLQ